MIVSQSTLEGHLRLRYEPNATKTSPITRHTFRARKAHAFRNSKLKCFVVLGESIGTFAWTKNSRVRN